MADILVVDDDADSAATVGELLEMAGHTVRVAHDGREGLDTIAERLPDLVVLDVEMPVLDGPGMAFDMIVRDAGSEKIPVVLISGFLDLDAVAARVGTPYMLPKPASMSAVLATIERALSERLPPTPQHLQGVP